LPLPDSKEVSLQNEENAQGSLNISSYKSNDYSTSTISSIENIDHDNFGNSDSTLPLHGLEYTQKFTQAPNYQPSLAYDQVEMEEQPLNGFNYKPQEDSFNLKNTKDSSYYKSGNMESILFEPIATTESPNVQKSQLQDYSPVYHSLSVQGHYEENETPRPIYHKSANQNNKEESPFFLPISQNKQEEFAYQTTITEAVPEVIIIFLISILSL
jgi:hypothetical protein